MRGLHDDRNVQARLAHAREHAIAVEIRHHEVEDHAIDARGIWAGEGRDRGVAAVRDHHLVTEAARHVFQETPLYRIVVYYQN